MRKIPKFYYVYLITNLITNKQYIGSRICYLESVKDDVYWGSSRYLGEDYKIYGKENFKKEIIRDNYTSVEEMLNGETYYIIFYDTLAPKGYNRYLPNKRIGFHMAGNDYSGEKNPMYGKRHSEETKIKMRKPKSEETKEKISKSKQGQQSWLGRHHSEESIEKMKKPKSEEHKQKLSDAGKGKIPWNKGKVGLQKHTEESKRKISDAIKGKKNPFYGKHHTEETREKLRKPRKPKNK